MMREHPKAAERRAAGLCMMCGLPGAPFCTEECAVDFRSDYGCGDEPTYCGSCEYEKAVFCLFTDGSGPHSYCGKSPGHEAGHGRRITPTFPKVAKGAE